MIEDYTEIPTAAPDTSRCATVTSGAIQPGDDLEETSPRAKRRYTFHVSPAERVARRAARRCSGREFRPEGGYIWERTKKIVTEFLPVAWVVGPDCLSAGVHILLLDGGDAIMPAAAVMEDGLEALSQFCAYHLLELFEPRAAGVWLREAISKLRDVRREPTLRYVESEERHSRHLIRLAEKATGQTISREPEMALTVSQ